MRATLVLFASFVRRDRTTLVALALLVFAFELLIIWLARLLDSGGTYENLIGIIPDFARSFLDFDISTLLSFSGSVGLGYFHPVVITCLVVATIVAARSPIAEIESRTAELLLARALRRRSVVVASLLEVLLASTLLPAAMMLGSLSGLVIVDRLGTIALLPYALLCLNGAAIALAAGNIFVLTATLSRRAGSYFQLSIGFALGSYLLHYLARLWTPLQLVDPLSLFHYLEPIAVLTGQGVTRNVLMLLTFAAVAAALSVVVFEQRDI